MITALLEPSYIQMKKPALNDDEHKITITDVATEQKVILDFPSWYDARGVLFALNSASDMTVKDSREDG